MAAQEEHEQPDWLSLPSDLLKLIALRSRDAVTGLTSFRSVCRAWRAASEPAPRLLIPRPGAVRLVFPLSGGWSIVFNAGDASCHVSHLATGATAALPSLNAFRDAGSDAVRHVRYLDSNDVEKSARNVWMFNNYLDFTDCLRFAAHLPAPACSPGPAAAGMTIMMYHVMHRETAIGMLFCRPGDAAWTKVGAPQPFSVHSYVDFAYHDGKMFGMHSNGKMAVFDATTLHALPLVQRPPATPKFANKIYGHSTDLKEFDYAHLVALPSKLVLVMITVKSHRPVAFTIFELISSSSSAPDDDGQLAWRKVDDDAGNYELFLDGYHPGFRENDGGANESGTWIYYVHDTPWDYSNTAPCCYNHKMECGEAVGCYKAMLERGTAAYRYSMRDNKLECVYKSSPKDDGPPEYSTKPSWFIP